MPNASEEPSAGSASATVTAPEPYRWHRPPAKVVFKADLLPAMIILLAIPNLGLVVGWLWSRMAPPQRTLVLADGLIVLRPESYHRFDDLALFLLLCLGAGLATGLGMWFLRERRGPVILAAAVLGSAGAGWLAKLVGVGWAGGRYTVTGTPKVGDVVLQAPVLESAWVLIAWPLTTALIYGVLAAWNGMDDLGRRLN